MMNNFLRISIDREKMYFQLVIVKYTYYYEYNCTNRASIEIFKLKHAVSWIIPRGQVTVTWLRVNVGKIKRKDRAGLQGTSIFVNFTSLGRCYKPGTFNHYEIRITSCCSVVIKPNLQTWPPMMWSFKVDIHTVVEEDATQTKENRGRWGAFARQRVRNQRPTIAISKAHKVGASLPISSLSVANRKIKKLIGLYTLSNPA